MRFCGHPDIMPLQLADSLYKWDHKQVTWSFTGFYPRLSRESQIEAFNTAWTSWEKVCGIKPKKVDSPLQANVLIGWGQIDGGSGTLAWSELPTGQSQLRQLYDEHEAWDIFEAVRTGKIDLVRVAAHEIGHALGLPHTEEPGNLMNPFYSPTIRFAQGSWEIREAVLRYGGVTNSPVPFPGGNMTREELRTKLNKYLGILALLARWVPGEMDDKIVAMASGLVEQDWFVDVLLLLLNRQQPVAVTAEMALELVCETGKLRPATIELIRRAQQA